MNIDKQKIFYSTLCLLLTFFLSNEILAQNKTGLVFTHQDSLRGGMGEGRLKWKVLHYDITIEPQFESKSIIGKNSIRFIDSGISLIQIDLQEPMTIDSIRCEGILCSFKREGNVYWVELNKARSNSKPVEKTISISFHGKPKIALNAPWDGGWIFTKDLDNQPWMSVACQGLGASVWYPCKDIQSEEPSEGAILRVIVDDSLVAISNGILKEKVPLQAHKMKFVWEVKNPINNYNIIPYIGKYKHFSDIYIGLKGPLNMNFWVLQSNLEKATLHFKQAMLMMKAFEYWFGPYPFYKDGYKLVEAPYLGMEHQSAIAYGNGFKNGYLGNDLSGSGWGLKWDFIIVHESGHEWFGNNITSKDIADMWIHESFTNYSEVLFTEYYYGKKAAQEYVIGIRKSISNENPIIGKYGVNKEGSVDMYYKGANLIHLIRQIINNDTQFRKLLIGMNQTFFHRTVTTADIENYISRQSGIDFSSIFNQYLRTVQIPVLEYQIRKNIIHYRWSNTIPQLYLPIKIYLDTSDKAHWINPSENWKTITLPINYEIKTLIIDPNFYVTGREIN